MPSSKTLSVTAMDSALLAAMITAYRRSFAQDVEVTASGRGAPWGSALVMEVEEVQPSEMNDYICAMAAAGKAVPTPWPRKG